MAYIPGEEYVIRNYRTLAEERYRRMHQDGIAKRCKIPYNEIRDLDIEIGGLSVPNYRKADQPRIVHTVVDALVAAME